MQYCIGGFLKAGSMVDWTSFLMSHYPVSIDNKACHDTPPDRWPYSGVAHGGWNMKSWKWQKKFIFSCSWSKYNQCLQYEVGVTKSEFSFDCILFTRCSNLEFSLSPKSLCPQKVYARADYLVYIPAGFLQETLPFLQQTFESVNTRKQGIRVQ